MTQHYNICNRLKFGIRTWQILSQYGKLFQEITNTFNIRILWRDLFFLSKGIILPCINVINSVM